MSSENPAEFDFRETLYTINKEGKRKWVYPSVISGRYHKKRILIAWFLIAIYLSLPWLSVGGEQAVHLDIKNRAFTFFGSTFWATDTFYLALVLASLAVSLFFFTALFGRVWCGWACPETVFLEFVFRPIETLIEGNAAKRRRLDQAPWNFSKISRKIIKVLVFAAVAWIMASTFLAYFIGRETLLEMMRHSPTQNLSTFLITCFIMAVLLFQFGWFREQFCTVLCPYARFQSALLDQHSLIVGYDRLRGEPRSPLRKDESTSSAGHCIDCGLCVRVCPTGIDIRNGLQLECIHCTACMDACDSIMAKINRPLGLIRYDTEVGFDKKHYNLLRPRIVWYASVLLCLTSIFFYSLADRSLNDYQIIRGSGDLPYTLNPDGSVSNHLTLKIANKAKTDRKFHITLKDSSQVTLVIPINPYPVMAGRLSSIPIFFTFPARLLKNGKFSTVIQATDENERVELIDVNLLGPGS